ncbi:unnamed protein product, partial [Staurois parvus]
AKTSVGDWLRSLKRTGVPKHTHIPGSALLFKVLLNPGPCVHYIWSPTVHR